MLQVTVIDLNHYKVTGDKAECEKAADSLHKYGILCIRHERAVDSDNDKFLDMMERYFESADFVEDARTEYHYQVGVTPQMNECARSHCARIASLDQRYAPVSLCPPDADKKSRFFWRVGDRPEVRNKICFEVLCREAKAKFWSPSVNGVPISWSAIGLVETRGLLSLSCAKSVKHTDFGKSHGIACILHILVFGTYWDRKVSGKEVNWSWIGKVAKRS
ncbi:hypothetical protein PsorP6_013052 [Peronosclerospora sorghi]|uniref:Uncharacterized protein n=1 Tax=Peronosclerospora sorghi TaxID=230839 RepID=A0ACC0WGV3_9STRA|nr:hypothetical protein PsorP6_019406 [Peronosclerospora sorghi]KAI9917315.1 hypothetical protein PsorP6_013052 [Peronosclerospora sorghi]